ncbi:MAG: TIGR03067 domain-containing protein [Isosphaeraceae bacterium]
MTRFALFALAPCLFMVAAGSDDAARTDRELIQGPWKIVSITQDGTKESDESVHGGRIEFSEDGYTVRANDQIVEQGSQSLDSSKQPKTIDFKITRGPAKGKTQPGIYQLEGDQLRVCFAHPGGSDRPKQFTSTTESRTILLVLRREQF